MIKEYQAFTLIELLVVILIIGILAAVALPQYQIAVAKSRYATIKNLVTNIGKAENIYYLAHAEYTNKFNELDFEFPQGISTDEDEDFNRQNYSWGQCWIQGKTNALCTVRQNGQTLGYQLWFSQSAHQCIAFTTDLNHLANKVCKLETGLAYPSWQGTSYTTWAYR